MITCRHLCVATCILLLPTIAFGQLDLRIADSDTTHNGAIFEQGAGLLSSGTGVFDPFYRMSDNDTTIRGINTDVDGGSTAQFETEPSAQWTTALLLSTVTQTMVDGVKYREFFLDINQKGSAPLYRLLEIEVWTDDQKGLDCFVYGTDDVAHGSFSTTSCGAGRTPDTAPYADMTYWLDGSPDGPTYVWLDYNNEAGSGDRDMRLMVADSLFHLAPGSTNCDYGQPMTNCSTYAYLFSHFEPNNDGFEEWSTAIQPFLYVTKTIEGTLQDSVAWDITKEVSPDSLDLFAGDSADVKYTVTITKTNTVGNVMVSGLISLAMPDTLPDGEGFPNGAKINAEVDSLIDEFNGQRATGITCSGDATGSPPFTLSPGDEATCPYSFDLGDGPGPLGDNVVTAWVMNREGTMTVPFSGSATLSAYDTTAAGEPDTVNVSDLLDGGAELNFGPFDDDDQFSYSRTFACNDDEGLRQNIASIDETTDADTATVDVDCWDLTVMKTVETSKVRYYTWTLDKGVDPDALNLFVGDSADTEFTIDITRTGADSGFVASGVIKVFNDAPIDAEVVGVEDTLALSPDVIALVDCGSAGPYTIAAGDSLMCSYAADVNDESSGSNTATAHQQNYNIDYTSNPAGDSTVTGTTPYSDTESVVFDGGTTVTYVDVTAELDDDNGGDAPVDSLFPNSNDCGEEVADVTTCQLMYEARYACDDEGNNRNIATLTTDSTKTVLRDTAWVNVACYEIAVAKNDSMEYTVEHIWTIDKSVIPESIAMFDGDTHDVEWTVAIGDSSYTTDWRLLGEITISNPNPVRDADLTSVADTLAAFGPIAVDCGGETSVPADSSLVCTYDTTPLDSTSNPFGSPNTATAHRQNYNFDKDGVATPTGTTPVSGSSIVDVADAAVTDTTSSVGVTDDNPDSSAPWTAYGDTSWIYTGEYACVADSGDHRNIAEITETGAMDSAKVRVDCYQLAVVKDAQTTLTQNYEWTIEKEQDTTWNMFYGDSALSKFTVDVTKSTKDSTNFKIDGNITVYNNTPIDAVLIDSLGDKILTASIWADVTCPVTFPDTLKAGEQLACTYMRGLPSDDADKNIAYAYQRNYDYDKDGVGSEDGMTVYTDSVDFDFNDPIVIIGADSSATAIDNLGTPGDASDDSTWTFGEGGTKMYEKGFNCSDEGSTTNTVVLVGDDTGDTLGTATATVVVNCYALAVTKDVVPSFKRQWDWEIWKTNVQDTLILALGQTYIDTAYYDIKVKGSSVDSAYRAEGMIWVANLNPIPAEITGLKDVLQAGSIDGLPDCSPASFPYIIAAGDSLACSYGPVDLPDDTNRRNFATAGLQNMLFHYANAPSNLPDTTYWTGSDTLDWTGVIPAEFDECVAVTDSFPGDPVPDTLGTFCASMNPDSTTYSDWLTITVPESYECDNDSTIINTARYTSNDNGYVGQDTSDVVLTVPCPPGGCTLTQGYWKTHNESFPGGAPPDETWCLIGDRDGNNGEECELEDFYKSGDTWFGVFWTPPQGGNAYYSLAHQYMAALLNELNGASTPTQVDSAITAADEFFNEFTPDDLLTDTLRKKDGTIIKIKVNAPAQAKLKQLAAILAAYNEGLAGIEHCDEDNNSSLQLIGGAVSKANAATGEGDADALAKSEESEEIPTEFDLGNYPNPFNPTTTILVALPEDAKVTIVVYDVLGRRVTSLIDKDLKAGYHRIVWDAGSLPSGQYFYSLQSEQYQQTKKMLLLK